MAHMLRHFRDTDADGVKELILSILSKEYPFDKSAYSDSDLNKIAETYGGPKDTFLVVEDSNEIVGTVGVKTENETDAILRRLFVDVKHRQHGYGSALVDKAIEFCRQKGYKRVFFRCTGRMANAMKLCLKKGFKETEKLEVGGFNIHKLELEIK
jgi:N-acetylglutamate synthase-like GNAT family acetyltransferase